MSALSDYLEAAILDHILGSTSYSKPGTVYLAVYTAAPSDSGGGTEVSGGSYARVSITNNSTNFPNTTVGSGVKANGAVFTFPEATANWGTVTHFGIFDAASGGNLLIHGALTSSIVINTGDILRVKAGDLSLTMA